MKKVITKIKIFICILALSLFILLYNVYYEFLIINDMSNWNSRTFNINRFFQKRTLFRPGAPAKKKLPDIKYVLMWTNPNNEPLVELENGHTRFIKSLCPYINCYVTSDRYFLEDYTQFDVVLFAGSDLIGDDLDLPDRRSDVQKYVFASVESSENYPLCSKRFNNYFNWTWTFRLDSESRWGYITIRNKKNKAIIGPKKVMHWMKLNKMTPVSKKFKKDLSSKTKAAAWFPSQCHTKARGENFVSQLKRELKAYKLSIDTYGHCGNLKCLNEECEKIIKKDYYFYLAFENSFDTDYVTENLLLGLRNNAVPIVFGGANYTSFMPDGIYLNARKLGAKKLARKMNELIKSPNKYAEYFKWTNHYIYKMNNESIITDNYCNMCKLINNKKKMKAKSVYKNFRDWWNQPNACRSYDKQISNKLRLSNKPKSISF
nr:alpha-(1,3)-fucosyltransferase C-like [Plodia interpunctella]